MNPKLDLLLERVVDVPRELVWRAWTEPEHLKQWFTPAPWRTTEAEIDLRPGGVFRTVMRGPDGEHNENVGCFLEIVPNERLVWTDALLPGYRPNLHGGTRSLPFFFTAVISLAAHGAGTKYSALVLHSEAAHAKQHADMGFAEGWGAAFDQLVAHVKRM